MTTCLTGFCLGAYWTINGITSNNILENVILPLVGISLIPSCLYKMIRILEHRTEFEKWEDYQLRHLLPEDSKIYAILKVLNQHDSKNLKMLRELNIQDTLKDRVKVVQNL